MKSIEPMQNNINFSIEKVLSVLFHDPERPLALLRKHKLESLLINSTDLIRTEIEQQLIDFGKVRDIASNILVTVNTRLRDIQDSNERGYLEQISKEVADYLLTTLLNSSKSSNKILAEITSALDTASKLNGYNFEALVALLKLNHKSSSLKLPLEGAHSYRWNGSGDDLDDLLHNMKDAGWISSTKSFERVFSDSKNEVLKIPFAKERRNELLALFEVLKDKALILPKGGKGHFHPLKVHLVDLENNFLFDQSPKTVKNIAKRNKQNWAKMIENAELWVRNYKLRQKSRLP